MFYSRSSRKGDHSRKEVITNVINNRFHVRLTEDSGASSADDNSLGVREDSSNCETAGAFDVHKERSGRGDKCLVRVLIFKVLLV